MSTWLDRVKTGFVIKTGDGQEYRPYWVNARKSKKFKYAQFEFENIAGSLVKKGEPFARVYNVEVMFQGGDHLDVAMAFDKSSDNKKAWTVSHPLYGSLYVQCTELEFDNTAMNVSKITGVIIETILDNGLAPKLKQTDIVTAQAQKTIGAFGAAYAEDAPVMKTVPDIQSVTKHINSVYASVSGAIADVQANVDNYQNLFAETTGILNPAIYDTLQIIGQTQALLMAPARFQDTVANRLAMFESSLAIINKDLAHIASIFIGKTHTLKRLYENHAGTALAGMCLSLVENVVDDYAYRPTVLAMLDRLLAAYKNYLDGINSLQTPTGSDPNSYIPDGPSIIAVQMLVFQAATFLMSVSAAAAQQRTYTLPYDDTIITLTYKLYGSDPDDSKKATLIANNNITKDELLVLRAGRKIIYYV